MEHKQSKVVVIGSGIGGLTTAALLAKDGYDVTVLEAQTYPGGCASTYFHKDYRFDSGATLAGGFQKDGPHEIVGRLLDLEWNIHEAETAWTVHLPENEIKLSKDNTSILENFPHTENFWKQQHAVADLSWSMAAQGLPFPPTSLAEALQIVNVGLSHFPQDVRLARYAFATVKDWLNRHGLDDDKAFKRFIDAQLLISAQTTSDHANALYGATALDLARQGVQHIPRGIGGLAEQLVEKIRELGGQVLYRHTVTKIEMQNGLATGVHTKHGRRNGDFFPADVVVANVTPWSLDSMLAENSPKKLRDEVKRRGPGWGAFVLHLGIEAEKLPEDIADHHQIVPDLDKPLGEGNSIFVSMSPTWDETRAPAGHRAVTITTHTKVQQWWDLLERDYDAYVSQKERYTEMMIGHVDQVLNGFKSSVALTLPGTPVTYQFYTERHLGMVGGFPQKSLFNARGPRVGIKNIRLVGDSIFPGQSTAGVTVGGIRVAEDIQRRFSKVQSIVRKPQGVGV